MKKRVGADDADWVAGTFAGARKAHVREALRRQTAYERILWSCEMSEKIRLCGKKASKGG